MLRFLTIVFAICFVHQCDIVISYLSNYVRNPEIITKDFNDITDIVSHIELSIYQYDNTNETMVVNFIEQIRNASEILDATMNIYKITDKSAIRAIGIKKYTNRIESRYNKLRDKFLFEYNTTIINKFDENIIRRYVMKNQEDIIAIDDVLESIEDKSTIIPSIYTYTNICNHEFSKLKSHFYVNQYVILVILKAYLIQVYDYVIYTFQHFIRDSFPRKNQLNSSECLPYGNYKYTKCNFSIDTQALSAYIRRYQYEISESGKTFAINEVYSCTLGEPIRNIETIELDGISQTFVAIEPDMSTEGKCYYKTCFVQPSGRLLSQFSLDGYQQTKQCRGNIWECKGLNDIEICYANDSSSKRYEGLRFNSEIYGNINSCPGGKYTIHSWRRWIFFKCDVCLCTCVITNQDDKRIQKISYTAQTSDIKNNMVVTNVKFVEMDKTIYIQIEQDQLSSLNNNSNINSSRVWKSITSRRKDLMEVKDMQRTMHLDDVIVPLGYVVTGIKFGPYQPQEGLLEGAYHKFQIHVQATPYDFIKNELVVSRAGESTSFWVTPQMMKRKMPAYKRERTRLHPYSIEECDDPPILSHKIKDSEPNQNIIFRSSGLKNDAGQSTIPYFDARPPFSKRPFPLSGIGLSLKGYGGPNGYLTLKTFPYTIPPINGFSTNIFY